MPMLLVVFYCSVLLVTCSGEANNYVSSASPCSCTINGRVYNLGPLASSDGSPRFQTDVDGWNYAYNPCIPFTIRVPECQDVAICRWDNAETTYSALGMQSDIQCQLQQREQEIAYKIPNNPMQKTWVRMKCNPKRKGQYDALFSVIEPNTNSPILEVEHNCCCPDACPLGKPLPIDHPIDYGKWIAVGISGLSGLCLFIGLIVYAVCRCRRRRPANDGEHLVPRGNGARPGEN